jgi:hypothetical protein
VNFLSIGGRSLELPEDRDLRTSMPPSLPGRGSGRKCRIRIA